MAWNLHYRSDDQHYRSWRRIHRTSSLRFVQFGKEVRRRRRAASLTIEQLAERAGLSTNYVGSVETGARDPSLSTVLALAKGLKMPAAELLGGIRGLGPAGLEAARLLEASSPEVQEAVLQLLRATARPRR